MRDGTGNLYGTTADGGSHQQGSIFELTPHHAKWQYRLLYDACGSCGGFSNPSGELIIDADGNLYGVATAGGAHNVGGVFELVHQKKKWLLKDVYDFCSQTSCTDGSQPAIGLSYAGAASGAVYDRKSPLYGVTPEGGAFHGGVAFKLTPTKKGWTEQTLYSFCAVGDCLDGIQPATRLAVDDRGNVFGATASGGHNGSEFGEGVAFKINPSGTESILYDFCQKDSCSDGAFPTSLILNPTDGLLYGTTTDGGGVDSAGSGLIFRVATEPSHPNFTPLYAFCLHPKDNKCPDGLHPTDLTANTAGELYGVAGSGKHGWGVLFSFDGSALSVRYAFCAKANCADGYNPNSPPVFDDNGDVFGTTVANVYELTP